MKRISRISRLFARSGRGLILAGTATDSRRMAERPTGTAARHRARRHGQAGPPVPPNVHLHLHLHKVAPAPPPRRWWTRTRKVVAIFLAIIGAWASLAQLQWLPTPPGPSPANREQPAPPRHHPRPSGSEP